MIVTGKAHKVGDHIDTDAIIPARYLVTTDTAELGSHFMEGISADWNARVSKNDVLVAGENFGCGSSREHAPLAVLGAGIPVVVAKSFARIFYRNGFNMGLTLLEVGEDADKLRDGDQLEVDTKSGVIRNLTTGESVRCAPVPPSMQELVDAGGLVAYVKHRLTKVAIKKA
ncbi:MAG TPA: 3-isopropylmalate dehydratase small subunit [Desulfovibrio sp.]|jgi:3-isopropylmalate/(R)-2-methylmalate dehydratase small subunit|uniref:3-isopropylmalate dehydratase small subunit n=1 Tax=Desulfovibrio TaxID=872 RepID=UPI00040A68AF|nr:MULTISPECIES: 3-isopropylmalate dehydratase small subunit [Desulfovibrio]MDY0305735.1 3-isopropylmalate dehydratase small subunit [Desulfovibrionaceae bacterium]HMM37328.1 3-isopropylmalate dehydratase small subunit [Desulfovibrio sp.]